MPDATVVIICVAEYLPFGNKIVSNPGTFANASASSPRESRFAKKPVKIL
jgi:hypothetical protein